MENGLTFRFEADQLKSILSGIIATSYVHVTFYLELNGQNESVMRAKAEAFSANSSLISQTAGCPVPPCAFTTETFNEDCKKLVDEVLAANKKE